MRLSNIVRLSEYPSSCAGSRSDECIIRNYREPELPIFYHRLFFSLRGASFSVPLVHLLFPSFQGSSEEPDYDQVPLPSLPPCPVTKASGATCHPGGQFRHQSSVGSQGWEGGEESEGPGLECNNTIKRRAKRDRNHTRTLPNPKHGEPGSCSMVAVNHVNHTATFRRSKSRSKSRSPGREIDRAAIVIVHHHTSCGHGGRGGSPDNLSESSISFHENEVNFDLSPGSMTRQIPSAVDPSVTSGEACLWYEGDPHGCVSVSREPAQNSHARPAPNSRTIQYSNWESCRESWFSSGSSELRPSSGSDCPPPRPPSFSESSPNIAASSGVTPGAGTGSSKQLMGSCSVLDTAIPATPHCLKRTRDAGTSTPQGGRGSPGLGSATLPRAGVTAGVGPRQSSRDSGSSSSRPNSRPGTRPNTR